MTKPGQKQKKSHATIKAAFLEKLAEYGNARAAAREIKFDRPTLYKWRKADADFAEAWDEAAKLGVEALEDEARRRAFEGVEKPVTIAGQAEVMTQYSDTLLMFLLKGARPEKYKDRVVSEASVTVDANVSVQGVINQLLGDEKYLEYAREGASRPDSGNLRDDGERGTLDPSGASEAH